jgi:general secretion pathway protein G
MTARDVGERVTRQSPGFTLIELLITLAILALLATLALPVTRTVMQREHEQQLRHDLREIRSALDAYKKAGDEGKFPKSVGASGYPPNLQVLVDGVFDQTDPKHKKLYFLRRIPRDPMSTDVSLTAEQTWGKRCFDSDADSPSEGDDVFDVYSKSELIGLNGAPYEKW